ncbi:unnamed protein product [Blepharisma stoltei]|uniref:Uncharacterized protein n=1 Tax=Blepharisma stoltei TaxID=1481888 RepID=A0AAU9JYX0_9CILI|nr:unnamed protein product [Blepharisma stoltei]
MNHLVPEIYLAAFKDSKKFERKGKLQDSLTAIERISTEAANLSFPISIDITKQIASLCNKLSLHYSSPVSYLRRAEQVLMNWLNNCDKENQTLDEKIFRLILLTFNNWASFHQESKNYHMALSYLMRALKIIDKYPARLPDSLQLIAKSRLSVSTLYFELRRYKEAIKHAEEALATLQIEMKQRLDGKSVANLNKKDMKKVKTLVTTYVIAFYTIGLSEEALGRRSAMLDAYNNAVKIADQFLSGESEMLQTIKQTLADVNLIAPETIEKRIHKPMKRRDLKLSLDNQIKKENEPFEFKTACSFPVSKEPAETDHLNSQASLPSLNFPSTVQTRLPGRYYSEEQLKKLQKKMTVDSQHRFVSVDEYFYTKISKTLNVKSDIKHLRPLTAKGAITKWEQEIDDKRKISDLRLRKHHRQLITDRNPYDHVGNRIDKLKEEDKDNLKRQEIAMKSKMKTKVYKNLMRALSGKGYNSLPPQRLYFKPPLIQNAELTHESTKSELLGKNTIGENHNFKSANDEIETIMDRINLEMKEIDFEMGIAREKTLEAPNPEPLDSNLAKSTLKTSDSFHEEQPKKKEKIRASLKRSTTGPRIQSAYSAYKF